MGKLVRVPRALMWSKNVKCVTYKGQFVTDIRTVGDDMVLPVRMVRNVINFSKRQRRCVTFTVIAERMHIVTHSLPSVRLEKEDVAAKRLEGKTSRYEGKCGTEKGEFVELYSATMRRIVMLSWEGIKVSPVVYNGDSHT